MSSSSSEFIPEVTNAEKTECEDRATFSRWWCIYLWLKLKVNPAWKVREYMNYQMKKVRK